MNTNANGPVQSGRVPVGSARKWFKVTLDKTGAILSCEEVDAAERSGKLVRYIESLDKAGACSEAKAWHERLRARDRERCRRRHAERDARGLCRQCGKSPRDTKLYCRACVDRKNKRRRDLRNGIGEPPRKWSESAEEARSKQLASQRARHSQRKATHPELYVQMLACVVLREFDALGPKRFRAWLVSEIERRSGVNVDAAEAAE